MSEPDAVRFGLLGPFSVTADGCPVSVGGPTAQAILAVLVSPPATRRLADHITTAVWGSPDGASEDSLWHYMSRLRRALRPIGVTITGCRPGWRIDLPPATVDTVDAADAVDAVRFDELLAAARALRETDPHEATRRLRTALELWRGPNALAGLSMPGIVALARSLDTRRLDAEEELAELELARGDAPAVLDRLRSLVPQHPGRGRLAAALVTALHMTGRTAEALQFADRLERAARRSGGPVHPALARASRAVRAGVARSASPLVPAPTMSHATSPTSPPVAPTAAPTAPATQDPDPVSVPEAGTPPASNVPFQVPADTSYFTGRNREVDWLVGTGPRAAATDTPMVTVIEGMGGLGKTALVVHVAHLLASRHADGVLFVDLHGFTPDGEPVSPEAALDTLLRGLGVPGQQIPADLDARAALYRSTLAGRQVLVVLDNAASEAQVRPLLPGAAGCRVLVTSRRRLAGLDESEHVVLRVLTPGDAQRLFRSVGGERVGPADAAAIESIVEECGRLPLAVRIAAARLRVARATTPESLLAELREAPGPLQALDDGDRSVAAVFSVSYRHLDPAQQRAFRLLGLWPGSDLDPTAAAALFDTSPTEARRLLDQLEIANLVEHHTPGRYSLHDLLRHHATATALAEEPADERAAATTRVCRHHADTAVVAADLAYVYDAEQRPRHHGPHAPESSLRDAAQALSWLDTELANLIALACHAADHPPGPEHTLHMAAVLRRHLSVRARCAEAEALYHRAHRAARRVHDRVGEVTALVGLGEAHHLRDRHEQAGGCFERALRIATEIDHRVGAADALLGLGATHHLLDHYVVADECFERARTLAAAAGYRTGELYALSGLGHTRRLQGRYDEAVRYHAQARRIAAETTNRSGELTALTGLGHTELLCGHYESATRRYEQALAIAAETGDQAGELDVLNGLGYTHHRQGRYTQAVECFDRVLWIAGQAGNRNGQLNALIGLAHTSRAQGAHDQAVEYYTRAQELAADTGNRGGELVALGDLGTVCRLRGEYENADRHYEQALAIGTDIGHRAGELSALVGLAHTRYQRGRYEQAAQRYRTVVDRAGELGNAGLHCEGLLGLGRTLAASGRRHEALACLQQALKSARELRQPADEARVHDALAHTHRDLHEPAAARRHWQRSLTILTTLGTADAEDLHATEIRANLSTLDHLTVRTA